MIDETNSIPSILGLTLTGMSDILSAYPAYRAKQILTWVYRDLVLLPARMSNLPMTLRRRLPHLMSFTLPHVLTKRTSEDGTTHKLAFRMLKNEPPLEAVLLINKRRKPTFCLSSQIGCAYGCAFCKTASMGFCRNLKSEEMIAQVLLLRLMLKGLGRAHDSYSIVFMGMGEPLANREELGKTLRLLNDKSLSAVSWRRISVSTVGIPEGIEWMAKNFPQVNLALSLNAPNDRIRRQLMPSHGKVTISDLVELMARHYNKTGRLPTFEYVLINGINSAPAHAVELARLINGRPCLVNLIPYNGPDFSAPRPGDQREFLGILRDEGIKATIRRSAGRDIFAACGQLATSGS